MCVPFFVSLWNFSRFRRVSPRCEGKIERKGRMETSVNDRLWLRSIISWNIASIHNLPPPRYAQMFSPSFPASFWVDFRGFGAGPQLKESLNFRLPGTERWRASVRTLAEAKCESRRYFRKYLWFIYIGVNACMLALLIINESLRLDFGIKDGNQWLSQFGRTEVNWTAKV